MRVILIQQDMGRRTIKYPLFPIGLCYIATALKDHIVTVFDPNSFDYPACFDKLREEVRRFKPDIAGISIRNVDTTQRRDLFVQFNTVQPTIDVIKEIYPDLKIIVGGTGYSIFAREILERLPQIDYGVYLEGEETTPELLENLDHPERVKGVYYRKDGEVMFSGERSVPDFSSFSIPRRDAELLDIKKYHSPLHNVMGVQGKRGCVFTCSYCSYPFLNERKLRLREPEQVVDEIEQLVSDYGIKGFTFVDSVFNVPEKHARAICEEMIKRGIKVEWGAWITPKDISVDFLELLREAGCRHIGLSPDAVSDRGLQALHKAFTAQDIIESLNTVRQVKGMAVGYNFFCNYPGMGLGDAFKILILLFKIPLYMPGRGGVGLGWIRLEPHNKLYDIAIKEGVIDANTNMLPRDEKELSRLFYTPHSQRYITLIFDIMLFMVDRILKPTVKFLFHTINRIRGRKSLYDS